MIQPRTTKTPKKVLVIGSGPIVIGQAAEFDYAGTQACRSLREEGVQTVLINSNPATIMTDTGVADVTYIEPLTVEMVEDIVRRERPDGVLATLGGQTGLNLAIACAEAGVTLISPFVGRIYDYYRKAKGSEIPDAADPGVESVRTQLAGRQLRHPRPIRAVQGAIEQRLEDRVLAIEMRVKPALGQPAALRYVVHARGAEAAARELLQRRIQYQGHARLGGQAQPAFGQVDFAIAHVGHCDLSGLVLQRCRWYINYRLVGCYKDQSL